jgi:lipopolysaccharide export system permease protein
MLIMRKTLYFYLLQEQGLAFLICLVGVTFVLVTGELLQLMRILFASSCSVWDIVEVILFTLPKLLLYAAPMAALLGTMLAFVRLNGDNELIAFRAAGTAFLEYLPPIFGLLAFATVFAFLNAIYVIPVANGAFEMKLRALGRSSIPSLLKEGTFISTIPKLVLFFRSVDHTDLSIKGIFLQDQRQPKEKVTIAAESAQIEIPPDSSNITFRLANGVITRIADNLKDAQSISFRNYDFMLSMDEVMGAAEKGPKKKREMNIGELLDQIGAAKDKRNLAFFSMELHQRLAFPSACLLLGLLGPPLGSVFRQRSRMTGITLGVGIFLAYYVILSAGKGLGENDIISPFFAVWTPNLLSFLLMVYLWAKLHRETPFSLAGLNRLAGWLRILAMPRSGESPAK